MRGHYNEDGDFIEGNRINIALWPVSPKTRWYCNKGHQMHLFSSDGSVSLDLPVSHWECSCKKITIEQRNQAYLEAAERIKTQYNLKILQYNRQYLYFNVVSSEFIGKDRIDAKRKLSHHQNKRK